jgi:hypothetical protein
VLLQHNKLATRIYGTLFAPHTSSFFRYFFLLYYIKSVISLYECLDFLLRLQRTMSLVVHILRPDVFILTNCKFTSCTGAIGPSVKLPLRNVNHLTVRYTPVKCMPIRCTPMRCMSMRCTPMRYKSMRHTHQMHAREMRAH